MTLAIQLLATAQLLINLVISNPQLPAEDKATALSQAFASIQTAQVEINKIPTQTVQTTQTTQQTQPLQQPTFSGIITPMETTVDKSEILAELLKVTKDSETPYFGMYILKVSVLNSKGEYINKAEVTMSAPEDYLQTVGQNKESRFTEARQNNDDKNWYVTFGYIPMTQGSKDITFTSGSLSTTLTINVQ